MAWDHSDIRFELYDDGTEDAVVILLISAPAGGLWIMGEPEEQGRVLIVRRAHAQGVGIGRNAVGPANLRVIADVALERLGFDEIVMEGALRTSGANPGRLPRAQRFTRRAVLAPRRP